MYTCVYVHVCKRVRQSQRWRYRNRETETERDSWREREREREINLYLLTGEEKVYANKRKETEALGWLLDISESQFLPDKIEIKMLLHQFILKIFMIIK